MGIVNVTPDSFSDGGRFLAPRDAIEHGRELAAEGADILDVGGESTRPGAEPVSAEEELRRVLPVIEGLVAEIDSIPARPQISIDTSKAVVAAAAIAAGAGLVNDVSAFRADPRIAGLVADSGVECCLMHMLGEPRTMQRVGGPQYEDVVDEVKAFLEQRLQFAVSEGVAEERIMLDPGIGFGKTERHNLELLRRLGELRELGRPILIGTSRKQFLGRIQARAAGNPEPADAEHRLAGTLASNVLAYERGASVFRVHDVAPVRDALAVAAATLGLR
ncbi:MAG TPA: dihydropteroate synthase [Solirubrobacteraceae bacterium]|jgi:dihydropteroate synthase|nr:dihydropteroate synthase [Solirubrobacteraceae bacterium]